MIWRILFFLSLAYAALVVSILWYDIYLVNTQERNVNILKDHHNVKTTFMVVTAIALHYLTWFKHKKIKNDKHV